jgi:hypothetical protein
MSIAFRQPTIEDERERLRKMSDEELIREGKAARFLCSPRQNYGKKPPASCSWSGYDYYERSKP